MLKVSQKIHRAVRGPLLVPADDGTVAYFSDGMLAADEKGVLQYAGAAAGLNWNGPVEHSDAVMLPAMVDIHTHVPQHPIRGHFVDGVPDDAPQGKLLAGLERNVFPAEKKCDAFDVAEKVVADFLADTVSHGVLGGAVFMTTSVIATEVALTKLPTTWSVGLVLMNQNCPAYLRTDEALIDEAVRRLAKKFGHRLIITDRFAVAVDSPLRKRASEWAREFGLRTQTHLNEQAAEKKFVERDLYPGYESYTDVYRRDGLLDHRCIAAHCIQMRDEEWQILRDTGTTVAHCPTSNLLLGSGVMNVEAVRKYGLNWAIATDVGASPTVSMLAEMGMFLQVHGNKVTASEALFRATLAPAKILGIEKEIGGLTVGPTDEIRDNKTGLYRARFRVGDTIDPAEK